MTTVSIKNVYLDLMTAMGRVDVIVEEAVRKYLIDTCVQKFEKAREKSQGFERKYGYPYADFCLLISDDTKLAGIEEKYPTWEADYMEWEYWEKESKEWKAKLEDILMIS